MFYVLSTPSSKADSFTSVRSFDNTRSETIQFHTPLTLIVGHNGSGKTTIIECLKYATTGDLPPNSKGGAFIHDPKLCGEREVLAQVKLSFKGTTGAKMVVTRSLQLTVKKTTRQQKTLEGQLLMIKEGERTAISSRVAELDQIMPQYLGVSRAVLDAVIFCHQDESLWPMSEPSVLKKKFDEIFEALKYTKAIDNLKALRKKQNEDLGKFKIMEQHCKEDKAKADKNQQRSMELQEEIEALRDKCTYLRGEMIELAARRDRALQDSEGYAKVLGQLEAKRGTAKTKQENIDDLRPHIKQMKESDEELEAMQDRYEERVAQQKQDKLTQGERYEELRQLIESNRQVLGQKQTELGRYEAEKRRYEQQLQDRDALIKENARRHNIRGLNSSPDDEQIKEFMQRLRKMTKDQDLHLQRVQRETKEELQKAQNTLSQLRERRSALQESKRLARESIASNDNNMAKYQANMDRIAVDEGGKAALESTTEEVESRLQKAKRDYETASWDSKIGEANKELRSLEDQGVHLNEELVQGTKRAGEMARLDHIKKELKDRKRGLDTMIGAHGDRIQGHLGSQWQPSSLEKDYQILTDQKTKELRDTERQRDGISRELEQAEFKLATARKELQQKKAEIQTCAQQVSTAIDDQDVAEYPERLSEIQDSRDQVVQSFELGAYWREYLEKALQLAEKKGCCRLCQRQYKVERDLEGFKDRLKKQVEKATDISEQEKQEAEERLQLAQEAGTQYDTWQRLSQHEVPALEAEMKQYESRKDSLVAELENQDFLVSEKKEAKQDIDSLARSVTTISKYHHDIETLEAQIQELSAKSGSTGLARTLEDIQDELKTLNEKTRVVRQSASKLTADRENGRARINQLELDLRDIKSRLADSTYQLERKADMSAQIEQLKGLNQEQRESMGRADKDLQDLHPEMSKFQMQYDDLQQRSVQKENELQQEAMNLKESLRQLDKADRDITDYVDNGGPNQLARCQREMENITDEISRLLEEQRIVTIEINKIQQQLQNIEETKRSIHDNLRLRRDIRDLETLRGEVEDLESRNAEADYVRLSKEAKLCEQKHTVLAAEQAGYAGEMKSKDIQLADLINDWETDYKDADYKYKESHIKVETTKAAVDDLARYAGALDKAIMKYHSIKMEEINRIIEELWQKTYQGTDVDTIMIRSDNENAKGNRSYNYRVCMVKQDAEMDMRGRCSAGQKVLASIIIRLALAECFGVNCGLIALDEPTTNLDRDNIRSLAKALHDIIHERQQQSNFQLIVITHDEEFLKEMQCADFCDTYYRISRSDRQKSIIERQSIAEVGL
ncbi:MAG: DNA repair protein rad50 [Cirrosporium novae-zelandiae]|nr:MAG: DNA repair protein rad50 [Cirrosporium novae-zelandiae]